MKFVLVDHGRHKRLERAITQRYLWCSLAPGVVRSCGEDLLQQLQERWQQMDISTSNVHADLQTFCRFP